MKKVVQERTDVLRAEGDQVIETKKQPKVLELTFPIPRYLLYRHSERQVERARQEIHQADAEHIGVHGSPQRGARANRHAQQRIADHAHRNCDSPDNQ
ncbi:hypothetical protein RRG08_066917 [Elysia crispata]|uniref:Uncharacterized protein n=1 Tax=Elysia crispata TaxID=231223 RepID=A0AAE0YZN3_9GAST|nr:hypothetical protein RRG08_066917 [Elysia crispata]